MIFTIDRHSGIPAYRQLMEQIRMGIASGLLESGQALPSTRALSAEIDTNPMTVSKAYGLLEREGLLIRRPGLPLVIADAAGVTEPNEEFRKAAVALAITAVQLGLSPTRAKRILGEAITQAIEAQNDSTKS